MGLSPDDVAALAHHKKMLSLRTKSLYILEEQEAVYGLNTPTHILSEIGKLTDQIKTHKEEIDRLEITQVQDKEPLSEVEYRVVLAESWDTTEGYPSVVGRTRLEFARLRLHISLERSKLIEWDIRRMLCQERIDKNATQFYKNQSRLELIHAVHQTEWQRDYKSESSVLSPYNSLIRLHPVAFIDQFLKFSGGKHVQLILYKNRWLELLGTYLSYDEEDEIKRIFHQFLEPDRAFNPDEWDAILPF